MRNPTYLYRSRHGVFYFRYPLPNASRGASTLRVSLHTRDPKLALRLARCLSYEAPAAHKRMVDQGMKYEDIRARLREHFGSWLEKHKAVVAERGPLPEDELASLAGSADIYDQQVSDGEPWNTETHDAEVAAFMERAGLAIEVGSPVYARLSTEYARAMRDSFRAAIAHSRSLSAFDFSAGDPALSGASVSIRKRFALKELANEFWKIGKRENRWTDKTQEEKTEHMSLLYEVFGEDRSAASVGTEEARTVRETLSNYPVHRTKRKETRNKSLAEVLAMGDLPKLHLRTINKYLQTYIGLFEWAVANRYVAENPFAGLTLRSDKANKEDPRIPFNIQELQTIRTAILDVAGNIPEHHKWGVLIGMYTGARLNEVAQLHLADICERDGILCFDINAKGSETTRKRVKNKASVRIVPVHPALIDLGLREYIQRVSDQKGNARLFPQYPYTASDGYGRNLGRWFNTALLSRLHLKRKDLVFHSLRHSMAERLREADVSEAHLMAIVGHEPGTTTLKTYNRNGFPPRQLLAALEKVIIG